MKKNCLLIASVLLFAVTVHAQSGNNYPTFILNDSFSHVQPKESTIQPKNYQLYSLKGFKLDCSKYDFKLMSSLNGGKLPDAIFIVSKAGNYVVELNVTGETLVDASRMHSLDNPAKQFKNFEKGDTPIIGIGTLKIKDGEASMQTYWVSMIDVK